MKKRRFIAIGEVFGRLTISGKSESQRNPCGTMRTIWDCLCACGNTVKVSDSNLKSGNSTSCGCWMMESSRRSDNKHSTHRESLSVDGGSAEYVAWMSMKARCLNVNHIAHERYAGRGISICERWEKSFTAFLSDMGRRPSESHSLDRKDNDGNYEPGNCRWATKKEQNRNSRGNHLATFNGQTKCLAEWAETVKIPYTILHQRIQKGWSVDNALTIPPRANKRRRTA